MKNNSPTVSWKDLDSLSFHKNNKLFDIVMVTNRNRSNIKSYIKSKCDLVGGCYYWFRGDGDIRGAVQVFIDKRKPLSQGKPYEVIKNGKRCRTLKTDLIDVMSVMSANDLTIADLTGITFNKNGKQLNLVCMGNVPIDGVETLDDLVTKLYDNEYAVDMDSLVSTQ
jgi:hypothetical protein